MKSSLSVALLLPVLLLGAFNHPAPFAVTAFSPSSCIPKPFSPPLPQTQNRQGVTLASSIPQQHHRPSRLFLSSTSLRSTTNDNLSPRPNKEEFVLRTKLRQITGFSLTALRVTLRGLTGVSVTSTMKSITGLFPTWFRYFLQPLLIMYYTPLMIFKSWCDVPARKDSLAAHEKIVEGWKSAIEMAEESVEKWPLHVNDEGKIESVQNVEIADAIIDSLDVAMNTKNLQK